MKKIFYYFILFLGISSTSLAQSPNEKGGKIREKMLEYVSEKLDLTSAESEKFNPIFLNYIREERQLTQENKDDRLVLQQKLAELRLRYRDQFKPIIGEKRSNDVFVYEREFIQKAREANERRQKG